MKVAPCNSFVDLVDFDKTAVPGRTARSDGASRVDDWGVKERLRSCHRVLLGREEHEVGACAEAEHDHHHDNDHHRRRT